MREDHIVSEVRRIREEMLRDAGGFENLVKKLREREKKHVEFLVTKRTNRQQNSINEG